MMNPMTTVSFDLPSEVFSALRRSPEEFATEMRLAAAIYWYSRGEISQGKAAEVAGIPRVAFIDELAKRKVSAFVVDPVDLKKELERE
jgi:predicted HTH domain antitoxin